MRHAPIPKGVMGRLLPRLLSLYVPHANLQRQFARPCLSRAERRLHVRATRREARKLSGGVPPSRCSAQAASAELRGYLGAALQAILPRLGTLTRTSSAGPLSPSTLASYGWQRHEPFCFGLRLANVPHAKLRGR